MKVIATVDMEDKMPQPMEYRLPLTYALDEQTNAFIIVDTI